MLNCQGRKYKERQFVDYPQKAKSDRENQQSDRMSKLILNNKYDEYGHQFEKRQSSQQCGTDIWTQCTW